MFFTLFVDQMELWDISRHFSSTFLVSLALMALSPFQARFRRPMQGGNGNNVRSPATGKGDRCGFVEPATFPGSNTGATSSRGIQRRYCVKEFQRRLVILGTEEKTMSQIE